MTARLTPKTLQDLDVSTPKPNATAVPDPVVEPSLKTRPDQNAAVPRCRAGAEVTVQEQGAFANVEGS